MAGKVSRILMSLRQEFAQVGPEYPNVVDWEKGLLQTSIAYSAYLNAVSLSKQKFVIACGACSCCSPCLNFLTHMSSCCSIVFLYTNMRALRSKLLWCREEFHIVLNSVGAQWSRF